MKSRCIMKPMKPSLPQTEDLFMTSSIYCAILFTSASHIFVCALTLNNTDCTSLVSLFRSPLRSDQSPQPHFPSSPLNGWFSPSHLRGCITATTHQMSLCTLKMKPGCPKVSDFIHPASHSSLSDGLKTIVNTDEMERKRKPTDLFLDMRCIYICVQCGHDVSLGNFQRWKWNLLSFGDIIIHLHIHAVRCPLLTKASQKILSNRRCIGGHCS